MIIFTVCGVPNRLEVPIALLDRAATATSRVVGGNETEIGEYPWQVRYTATIVPSLKRFKRVVEGEKTEIGEYPWQVRLRYNNSVIN